MKRPCKIKVRLVNTIPKAFEMLMLKRIDLIYYHNLGLEWNIKYSEHKNDLEVVKNPYRSSYQSVAFSKKVSSVIVTQIAEELSSMTEEGILTKILQEYR